MLVGGRETELQRKWMSSKPLISTSTRDGQAYETGFKTFNLDPQDQGVRIVPHHKRSLFCPFNLFLSLFFTCPSHESRSLSVTMVVTISAAGQCAIIWMDACHVTQHVMQHEDPLLPLPLPPQSHRVLLSLARSLNLEIRCFGLDGGNP